MNEYNEANAIARQTGQAVLFDTSALLAMEPTPLPENELVLDCFFLVAESTHSTMTAVPGPPIWSDIRAVLELHECWYPELQTKLSQVFRGIRSIRAEEAEEKQPTQAIDLTKR